jgi:ion channel-forming bestrophin family protein
MSTQTLKQFSNHRDKRSWLQVVLNWQASVIPAIFPRVIFCSLFGLFISYLHSLGFKVGWPILSSVVPSIVLGLLLVFRTNTAYERFWEGRKLWGVIVNTSRNLARTIWVSIKENNPEDRKNKIQALRLLIAFAVGTKLHLRSQDVQEELLSLVPQKFHENLTSANNRPLEIAFLISDYLQEQNERNCVSIYQVTAMFKQLDLMIEGLGGCERILKTPIPLAYAIHLKQLLLIYCISLPFQMVMELHWWTGLIVGLISFTVFGIEEIGIEIENPFGNDPNDLPLDTICQTMQRNIEDLMDLDPFVSHWKNDLKT